MEMDYGAYKEQRPTLEDEFKMTGIDYVLNESTPMKGQPPHSS